MSEWGWIGPTISVLGPVATVLAVMVGLLFYLYRRDHLLKAVLNKEERDHLMRVIERNAQSLDKLAEAVSRSSEVSRTTAEQYTHQIEDMVAIVTGLRTRRGRR